MDARLVFAVAVLAAAPAAAWAALSLADDVPERFATPAAHFGDSVVYAVQSPSGETSTLRLQWIGPHEVQAADGSRSDGFAIDVVRQAAGEPATLQRVFVGADGALQSWSDELQNETLAYFGAAFSDAQGEVGVALPAVAGANHVESRLATRTTFAGAMGAARVAFPVPLPCGITHGFQGRSASTGIPVLDGDCGDASMRLLGEGTAADRPGRALLVGSADVKVWLHGSTPYPLQIERLSEDGWTRFHLVSSASSGHVITWSGRDAMATLPEAPTAPVAPRMPWGPVDDGVSHPLPLSFAFDRARTALDFPDLRDFLASHPQAYVAAAEFTVIEEAERRRERWEFEVSDGMDTLAVLVETPGPAVAVPSSPTAVGYGSHGFQSWGTQTTAPRVERAPTTLPTVAGLLDLWGRFEGHPTDVLPAWSFRIACVDEACTSVESWAAAGVSRLHTSTPAVLLNSPVQTTAAPVEWDGVVSRVAAGPDGALLFRYDSTYQVQQTVVPAPVVAQATPATLQAPEGELPSPLVLAGTAVLLVAFGLAAKVAGAALFTRLRSSRLLENPLRARLHDLVQADPGVHYQALQARSGIPRGTLDHHLRKLVDGGLLRRLDAQGFVCYFPTGTDSDLVVAAPALKAAAARRVLRDIGTAPGVTAMQLAQAMGIEPSTVGHHVERLMEAGLVHRVRSGRAYALHLTARGGKALLARPADEVLVGA